MPIIMAKYYAKGRKDAKELLWTNLNAPNQLSRESVNVFAKNTERKSGRFVKNVEQTFSFLWNKYEK